MDTVETQRDLNTANAVGEAILAAPQLPMDRATSDVMVRLLVAGNDFALPENGLPLAIQIAKARAAAHNIPTTDAALLMVGQLCDRPGTVVMYCAVLKVLANRLGRSVTVADLCEAFPMGFPDEAALTAIWDRQKIRDGKGPDNWLDRDAAWAA